MNQLSLVTLIETGIMFLIAIFVYFKNRKIPLNQLWAVLNLIGAAWFLTVSMSTGGAFASKEASLFLMRLGHFLSLLGSVVFLHFVLVFTDRLEERKKTLKILYPVISILIILAVIFPQFFIKDALPKWNINYTPIGGPLYFLHILLVIICLFPGFYEMHIAYRQSSGYKHNQIKYLISGVYILAVGMASSGPMAFGVSLFPYGFYIVPVYAIAISYAVVKYRLMDIDVIINNALLFLILVVSALTFHIGFVYLLQPKLGYLPSSLLSVGFIGFILGFTPFRYKVRKITSSIILKGKYDYQQILQESTTALVTILDLSELLNYIIQVIMKNVGTKRVSLLWESEEEDVKRFRIKACYGLDKELVNAYMLEQKSEIASFLTKRQIFIKEEMERALPKQEFENIYDGLDKIGAKVVIPLIYKDELKGMLNLDDKASGQMYNDADLRILETLGTTAAIAIENAQLYDEAITDSLTRLYHNRYFKMRLEEEINRSKRYKGAISLLMMDLDHFKDFNDRYGHLAGDILLKEVANIIKANTRKTDIAARYGGEEFALILPQTTREGAVYLGERLRFHIESTVTIAERIRRGIAERMIEYAGEKIGTTISIGISSFDGTDQAFSGEDLIKEADEALYKAKEEGRNKVKVYEK